MSLSIENQRVQELARQARLDILWSEIEAGTTDAEREATRRTGEEMYDDAGIPR